MLCRLLLAYGLFTEGPFTEPGLLLGFVPPMPVRIVSPLFDGSTLQPSEPWKHVTETVAPTPYHRDEMHTATAFDWNAEPVPVAIIPDSPAFACAVRYDKFRRGIFDLTG
jgi:hypothetical protein